MQNLQKTSSLECNLELAKELLADTLNAVPFSPNNIDQSREIIEKKARKKGVALNDLAPIVREAEERWFRMDLIESTGEDTMKTLLEDKNQEKHFFNIMKLAAQNTQRTRIGVCTDMATVGLFKGMEKGVWNILLSKVSIGGGCHTFLVIGRDINSNPKDYTTWGPNAVVMDAWAKKIYKLSDVEQNLYDYLGYDLVTGKPHLQKFNPDTQRLYIDCENICSIHDLLEVKKGVQINTEQDEIYQNAIELLENFHQAKTLPGKLEVAKSLKKRMTDPAVSGLHHSIYLFDQMNHFIELSSN